MGKAGERGRGQTEQVSSPDPQGHCARTAPQLAEGKVRYRRRPQSAAVGWRGVHVGLRAESCLLAPSWPLQTAQVFTCTV